MLVVFVVCPIQAVSIPHAFQSARGVFGETVIDIDIDARADAGADDGKGPVVHAVHRVAGARLNAFSFSLLSSQHFAASGGIRSGLQKFWVHHENATFRSSVGFGCDIDRSRLLQTKTALTSQRGYSISRLSATFVDNTILFGNVNGMIPWRGNTVVMGAMEITAEFPRGFQYTETREPVPGAPEDDLVTTKYYHFNHHAYDVRVDAGIGMVLPLKISRHALLRSLVVHGSYRRMQSFPDVLDNALSYFPSTSEELPPVFQYAAADRHTWTVRISFSLADRFALHASKNRIHSRSRRWCRPILEHFAVSILDSIVVLNDWFVNRWERSAVFTWGTTTRHSLVHYPSLNVDFTGSVVSLGNIFIRSRTTAVLGCRMYADAVYYTSRLFLPLEAGFRLFPGKRGVVELSVEPLRCGMELSGRAGTAATEPRVMSGISVVTYTPVVRAAFRLMCFKPCS